VLDLFARKIVGWVMAATLKQELTSAALDMAQQLRQPSGSLLHHSDRGSQYAACEYRERLTAWGVGVSMSRKGNCWDNAPMESLNASDKVGCVNDEHFATREAAIHETLEYIGYYNAVRRHSKLGNLSPNEYERRLYAQSTGGTGTRPPAEPPASPH
jgi:putative transposase